MASLRALHDSTAVVCYRSIIAQPLGRKSASASIKLLPGAAMPNALQILKECALIDLRFAQLDVEFDGSREAVARALHHADEARAYLSILLAQMSDDVADGDESADTASTKGSISEVVVLRSATS